MTSAQTNVKRRVTGLLAALVKSPQESMEPWGWGCTGASGAELGCSPGPRPSKTSKSEAPPLLAVPSFVVGAGLEGGAETKPELVPEGGGGMILEPAADGGGILMPPPPGGGGRIPPVARGLGFDLAPSPFRF